MAALAERWTDGRQYLMVDVVTNHMAYDGCGTCVDYSTLTPFNKQSYYHDFCLIDYDDPTSTQVVSNFRVTTSITPVLTQNCSAGQAITM